MKTSSPDANLRMTLTKASKILLYADWSALAGLSAARNILFLRWKSSRRALRAECGSVRYVFIFKVVVSKIGFGGGRVIFSENVVVPVDLLTWLF